MIKIKKIAIISFLYTVIFFIVIIKILTVLQYYQFLNINTFLCCWYVLFIVILLQKLMLEYDKKEMKLIFFSINTFLLFLSFIIMIIITFNCGDDVVNKIINNNFSIDEKEIIKNNWNKEKTFSSRSKIVINSSIIQLLSMLYQVNEDEYAVCFEGEIVNLTYYVNNIKPTKTITSDEHSVTHYICNKNTIISLHKHPPFILDGMIPSSQDIISHENGICYKHFNSSTLLGIQYSEKKYAFYGYGNYKESIKYEIVD